MLPGMWKPADALVLTAEQRESLEALARSGQTPQRVAARALIVLAAAEGRAINGIAQEFGVSRPTVYLWRDRFQQAGVLGLVKDAPRPGRRPAVPAKKVAAVVEATLHTTPRDATHRGVSHHQRSQTLLPPTPVHRG